MPIFNTMKFRLLSLGVVLLLLGVSIRLFFALPFAQDQLRDLVAAQQLSIASYVARDVDHSVLQRRALLNELRTALPSALLSQPAQLSRWLEERQYLNPLFNKGLAVLRPDGNGALAQYPVITGRAKLAYADAEWFRAALHTDGPVMSKPLRGRATGEPVLIMAAAIRDPAGRVLAVLTGVVALNVRGFINFEQIRLGATGGFLLISPADQLFVGSSDAAMVLKSTPAAGVNLLHDRAMAGFRGTGSTINANGVEELAAVVSVPSTGWFVVARMPTAEAFHPITAMRSFTLKSTLITLVVVLTALLLVVSSMLRPLTNAVRSMREMADGKRPLEPLPVKRRDEVGDMVLGFNHLVERLHEKEAALLASEARLGFMAHHDKLTGLCNRAMLEDRLQQALSHAERDGTRLALLYCDLDGFKPINDQFGHEAGDVILRQVAARLLKARRRTDTVARVGGDEFVVLVTDLNDLREMALNIAQQLVTVINLPFDSKGQRFMLGASIGIALFDGASISASQLLARADSAMYQAKRAGKNRVCVFSEESESLVG